jgi:quercetin dioxygenase-like cupin family protein
VVRTRSGSSTRTAASSRALFSPDDKGGFEFYELFLAGHSREDAEAHAPGTRENLLVTTGRLVLEIGSERHDLAKGDAIAFTADVPHAYVNPASEECWMSLVMTSRERRRALADERSLASRDNLAVKPSAAHRRLATRRT